MVHWNNSVPFLSNWGYKAKLLYLSGSWPDGWMTDYDGINRQPHYPPGLALLCAHFYLGAGWVADYAVRVLPPIFLAGACAALLGGRVSGPVAWSWAMVPMVVAGFLDTPAMKLMAAFYAEPMLALFLCLAMARLRGCASPRQVGIWFWLLLAGAAWIKLEGAVLYLVALLAMPLLDAETRKNPRASLRVWIPGWLVGLVLVAPWWAYAWMARAPAGDMPGQPWDFQRFLVLGHAMLGRAMPGFPNAAGFGWLLPALLVATLVFRDWPRVFGLLLVLAFLAGILATGTFSPEPVDWFVRALPRLLWIPGILCLAALLPPPPAKPARS